MRSSLWVPPVKDPHDRSADPIKSLRERFLVGEDPPGDLRAVEHGERKGRMHGWILGYETRGVDKCHSSSIHAKSTRSHPRRMRKKKGRPDIRERFGFAVKTRRESLGLTREDLAETARIHRTHLSDVERGTGNLSLVNIGRLADAPHMKLSELFATVEQE